jgi:redox-sensitive bicupin YhaK (pirin superfamily)
MEARKGRWCLLASGTGREGSMPIHQDAEVYVTTLAREQSLTHKLHKGRHAWLQVARGQVSLNGEPLHEGDGAAVSGETSLEVRAMADAEVLLFDLV